MFFWHPANMSKPTIVLFSKINFNNIVGLIKEIKKKKIKNKRKKKNLEKYPVQIDRTELCMVWKSGNI